MSSKTLLFSLWVILVMSGSVFSESPQSSQVEMEEEGKIDIRKLKNNIKVRDLNAGKTTPGEPQQFAPQARQPINAEPTINPAPVENQNLEDDLDQTIAELSNNSHMPDLEGLKKVEGGGDPINSFMQRMQSTLTSKLLTQNPLKLLPKDQMRSTFMTMIDGTPYKKIMENNPRLMNFTMDWLVDDHAIKGVLNIPTDSKRSKNYLYILIGFFILTIIINHFMTKNASLLKKIFVKLFMIVFSIVGNLSVFYFMFKTELDPTVDLLKKHFL